MPPVETKHSPERKPDTIDHLIGWVGSVSSLAFHTIVFVVFFFMALVGFLSWSIMLLVLTTVVSLEAIYLAIFIQMTVNRHTESLRGVEEDIDEIEGDIDELQEDVEEISEDDVKDAARRQKQAHALETLTADVRRVLTDLEALKRK